MSLLLGYVSLIIEVTTKYANYRRKLCCLESLGSRMISIEKYNFKKYSRRMQEISNIQKETLRKVEYDYVEYFSAIEDNLFT